MRASKKDSRPAIFIIALFPGWRVGGWVCVGAAGLAGGVPGCSSVGLCDQAGRDLVVRRKGRRAGLIGGRGTVRDGVEVLPVPGAGAPGVYGSAGQGAEPGGPSERTGLDGPEVALR